MSDHALNCFLSFFVRIIVYDLCFFFICMLYKEITSNKEVTIGSGIRVMRVYNLFLFLIFILSGLWSDLLFLCYRSVIFLLGFLFIFWVRSKKEFKNGQSYQSSFCLQFFQTQGSCVTKIQFLYSLDQTLLIYVHNCFFWLKLYKVYTFTWKFLSFGLLYSFSYVSVHKLDVWSTPKPVLILPFAHL